MNIQNKFKKTNVIYKITKDYDLDGSTLIIPVGCTLDFQGGSFANGTIEGHDTKIISELRSIFKDKITITGTWDIIESYPEWFGAKSDGITDNTGALQNCINYFNIIKISSGTYVTNRLNIPSFKNIIGEGKNSIIKANPDMPLTNSYLIRTKDGGSGIRISNLKIICGNTSNEDDYKIGGIGLISTSNNNNDQWDTRNIIENVEILNCYAASIYIGTYQRENKIQNCFISNTTNNGINCQGTDNMINGCTIAGSHLSGIMLQTNNRLSNTKLFGCGGSTITKNLYALDIFGNKCNVSNVELQQNYYGGVIVRGNSNYVQVTNDNNGSGNPAGITIGASIIGNYNTVIVTSYNFSFHDDAYERYFISTNWSTIGNNIIVNGTPLKNNKMSSLPPWSIDNICNNINWNGHNLTQDREVSFDKLVIPYKYRTNGTGSFYTNDTGLSFKIVSATAVNVDVLSYSIPIYNAAKVDPDGCFSIKARFHKNNDANDSIYPVIRINTIYKNSAGKSITRTDQNTVINLLDNKDSLDVYALSSYHHLSDKAVSISSISIELAVRSTKVLSGVSINAYFDDIKIGATTSGDTVRFVNTNIDGTSGNRVVIANEASDFILENVIYKIVSDINLGTAALEIPANCTLDFQGGSIVNGVITSNQIKIKSDANKIFNNISFGKDTLIKEVRPEWFGAKGDGVTDDADAIQVMFNVLSACLPKYSVNNLLKPDFSKVKLVFEGKYAIADTIVIPTHYRLNIANLNLIGLTSFTGDYLLRIDSDSYGLSLTNCILDGALVASGLGINAYSLDTTIQGCTFTKFKEFGINGYSETANGHELKILNTKINQFEYQEFPNSSITTGIGLALNSRRHDNNFNNLVINYCTELNYKLEGSANTFVNCHFYNKGLDTFNISGQYTTFQSCYFDGVGTQINGATTIDNCFYTSNKEDASTVFIKLINDTTKNWLHGFDLIRNNIFRNNSSNTAIYNSPISTDDGSSISSINYTLIDNRFFNVTESRKQSSNFKGTTIQTNTQRISNNTSKAIRLGNMLIQYGYVLTNSGVKSITFDIPYNDMAQVIVTPYNSSSDPSKCYAYNVTNAGFSVNGTNFYWMAIGSKNI